MGIIYSLIIGLIVGAVAKFFMPGKDPGGCLITSLLGIVGGATGSYLGQAMGLYRVGEPAGFIGAVLGAMLILLVYRLVFRKS
jgi:uncharacterized membrane protein YeaQ/YmgE (transglycosylase-associated protein family)